MSGRCVCVVGMAFSALLGVARPAVVDAQALPTGGRSAAPANRVMGTGEPREPQPFTREQRVLEAARQGDLATISRGLDLGVDVNVKDDLGRSALLLAARDAGDIEVVRFLRERGAAVDEADAGGRTALSYAAAAGRLEIARYLSDQGARIDHTDKRGRTALFHAVLGDRATAVEFLIERGADVNVQDTFGDTPMIMACAKGFGSMAALLLTHGADPSIRNQEGRTARDRSAPGLKVCRPGPG